MLLLRGLLLLLRGTLMQKLLLLLLNVLLLLLKLLLLGVKLLLHLLKEVLLLRSRPRRRGRRWRQHGGGAREHLHRRVRSGSRRVLASSELAIRLTTSGGDRGDGRSVLGLKATSYLHEGGLKLSPLTEHRLTSLLAQGRKARVDQGSEMITATVNLANASCQFVDPCGELRVLHGRGRSLDLVETLLEGINSGKKRNDSVIDRAEEAIEVRSELGEAIGAEVRRRESNRRSTATKTQAKNELRIVSQVIIRNGPIIEEGQAAHSDIEITRGEHHRGMQGDLLLHSSDRHVRMHGQAKAELADKDNPEGERGAGVNRKRSPHSHHRQYAHRNWHRHRSLHRTHVRRSKSRDHRLLASFFHRPVASLVILATNEYVFFPYNRPYTRIGIP